MQASPLSVSPRHIAPHCCCSGGELLEEGSLLLRPSASIAFASPAAAAHHAGAADEGSRQGAAAWRRVPLRCHCTRRWGLPAFLSLGEGLARCIYQGGGGGSSASSPSFKGPLIGRKGPQPAGSLYEAAPMCSINRPNGVQAGDSATSGRCQQAEWLWL